jgi:hypothetical protein
MRYPPWLGNGLAAFAVWSSVGPAVAGRDDCRWQPPVQYRGDAKAPYRVIRLPQPEVQEACAKGLAAADFPMTKNYRGCALAPVKGKVWRIYIVRGGYKCASEKAILEHELGHVNGWPHDHSQ